MPETDVIIVGAGLAGSLAASVLARRGISVALVDRRADPAAEFKVEQIVGGQCEGLGRLGAFRALTAGLPNITHTRTMRRGRVLDVVEEPHYGASYQELTRRARATVPGSVALTTGVLRGLACGEERQSVTLNTGQVLEARLVVLATGPFPLAELGFAREEIRHNHSLSFGFDITVDPSAFGRITGYGGERPVDRIDYFTAFRMGDAMRANLFTYMSPLDPWAQAFRAVPNATLRASLPGLSRALGDYRISGKIDIRALSLFRTLGLVRPGVVVIGDAAATMCPAVGNGVSRLVTDVDVLCNTMLPRWLASPGMGAQKICEFYHHPLVVASKAEGFRLAEYRRNATIERSLRWRAHRARVTLQRRVRHIVGASGYTTPPVAVKEAA